MVSAAVREFNVRSPRDGGQSIKIKSYLSLILSIAAFILVSLEMTETNSTSAPTN